jgi:hypothetical protein
VLWICIPKITRNRKENERRRKKERKGKGKEAASKKNEPEKRGCWVSI